MLELLVILSGLDADFDFMLMLTIKLTLRHSVCHRSLTITPFVFYMVWTHLLS